MRNGQELELEWRRRISWFSVSGQTKNSYCQAHDFSIASYCFLQAELRRRDAKPAITPMPPRFVPISVIPTAMLKV